MLNKKLSLVLITLLAASCSSNASKSSTQVESKETKESKSEKIAVFFNTAKSSLTEDALKILDKDILPEIKDATDVKVTVEGHCDERGTEAYNDRLGKDRANAVKSYLVKNGVKSAKIKTVSYGESKPVDFRHDESAWEKNRRAVTIIIEKK